MPELSNTQYFKVKSDTQVGVKQIIGDVFAALSEKGYNPVGQIVGYIMSGDPRSSPVIIMPETSFRMWRGMSW